jgi:hypothetical protein
MHKGPTCIAKLEQKERHQHNQWMEEQPSLLPKEEVLGVDGTQKSVRDLVFSGREVRVWQGPHSSLL